MKHDAKALIILSPGFPKDEADTTCLPSQQVFIKALNKNFTSLKIIIVSFQYPFSVKAYEWFGNTVIPFNGMGKGLAARLLLWRRLWRTLRELKRKNDIVGLFSFWCGECAFIGRWFSKFNTLKHFCWISGQDASKGNKYIKLIGPKSSGLIAMSDFLQNEFYKNYGVRPGHVVPIGIEPAMFASQPDTKDIDVIGAGSLIGLKQYDIFISIIKALSFDYPSIKTIICGKGPEEKKLRSRIDEMELKKNISLAGEKSHPEILDIMQRSKIFLHTSSYEGFGAVCIEALFAGCHVVSFTKPMQRDIEHWHIVHNELEMVEKVTEILKNPATKYTAVSPYMMDDSCRVIMHLFDCKEAATS
jgi:glycosyltransferase involved in cell wall biosynthesis